MFSPVIRNGGGPPNNICESSTRKQDFTHESTKLAVKSVQINTNNTSRQVVNRDDTLHSMPLSSLIETAVKNNEGAYRP